MNSIVRAKRSHIRTLETKLHYMFYLVMSCQDIERQKKLDAKYHELIEEWREARRALEAIL